MKERNKTFVVRAMKWLVFIGTVLLLGLLVSFAAFILIPPVAEREAAGAEDFYRKFLASMIADTDFYKQHATEAAILRIKDHRDLFSSSYYDSRKKCQRGWYEYYVIFNGNHGFIIGIEAPKGDFIVKDFRYCGVAKKRSWSEPPKTEEATQFFRQILFSINNETDFYKQHSTESTMQEIQTYRSMISSNNVLIYRHWEGEYNYYFYVEFDGKHGFEVYVEASKGCIVKSFTYLGERGKWKIRWLDKVSH
jgi:predicted LPLAT superfamily acyltransferase